MRPIPGAPPVGRPVDVPIRSMRIGEEAYSGWTERRLTQEDAARLLGVCARTFRRYIDRYEEDGLDGLPDKRLTQLSHRRAPVDEVLRLVDRYRRRHDGWNVKHYYSWYRRDGGQRSYSWVKNTLQAARVVKKAAQRGAHRKRREPAPWPGMLLHQDGSDHEWVPGRHWDLIVTMDDATNDKSSGQTICTAAAARRVAPRDGRNELPTAA